MNAAIPLPRDLVARRVIAVPWRHAGLIAVFALAGGLASASFWPHPAPTVVEAARPHMQAIQDAPGAPAAGLALRLDPEPGAGVGAPAVVRVGETAHAFLATLRLDAAGAADEIDAVLREAPPAAGRLLHATADTQRPRATLPGLAAGLLVGLLAAALRELGGQRMRSPREAQWALGAPVLGAIPTLSAKARDALVEPSPAT